MKNSPAYELTPEEKALAFSCIFMEAEFLLAHFYLSRQPCASETWLLSLTKPITNTF